MPGVRYQLPRLFYPFQSMQGGGNGTPHCSGTPSARAYGGHPCWRGYASSAPAVAPCRLLLQSLFAADAGGRVIGRGMRVWFLRATAFRRHVARPFFAPAGARDGAACLPCRRCRLRKGVQRVAHHGRSCAMPSVVCRCSTVSPPHCRTARCYIPQASDVVAPCDAQHVHRVLLQTLSAVLPSVR